MKENYHKEPYSLFVAKSDAQGLWLPYYAHLMDTAGIIECLVNRWLPGHIINVMSKTNPDIDWSRLCRFIALTHDIGKATPIFQATICDRVPHLRDTIENYGIELQHISKFMYPKNTPHSFSGEAILLNAGCSDGIAAVVGTHHGGPCSGAEDPRILMECYEQNFYGRKGRNSDQGRMWDDCWQKWIDIALENSGYEDTESLPEIDTPAQMILSGLLMMADWIVSNSEYAPLLEADDNGKKLDYPERIEQIWKNVALPDQWMPSCWFIDDKDFRKKYGFLPNAMQKCVLDAVEEASAPGIYILEAQMGLGKTEAAFSATEILASKWACEGLFFGLPTQATANGIFPRLKSWANNQSEDVQLSIRLAHGMAKFHEGYREIFRGFAKQNEDVDNGGLIVHNWFEGRKQALLSSFVVGTVDQLLMSALQQKHVMLRHLGLAGKVVVIDECHAYDAYMNCYLERALEWLGMYDVPVILLSATLPSKQRAKLIRAYCREELVTESDEWYSNKAYPLLTYTDGDCIKQNVIPTDGENKKIKIVRGTTGEIIKILKEKLVNGGCAGVVFNTVIQAQKIAKNIREEMPEYEIILAHARYTVADRQHIETELLERLGKTSTVDMRNTIVVGTQILEQSLDIDFDLLITQLAPMDLLLQRMGRLHRHSHRQRPKFLTEPECIVCDCQEMDTNSEHIYGKWLLKRTKKLLPDEIDLPDDISPLVQETYRDLREDEEFYEFWLEQMERQTIKESKAKSHRILSPKGFEETIHGLLDQNVGDRESDALARVRDGEPSIYVLLMVHLEEGIAGFLPWQDEGERIPMDHVPTESECCKILLQKVQLPRVLSVFKYDDCVEELERENIESLQEWQRSKWLNGELVLMLGKDMKAEICGFNLSYDIEYGLVCEKEE